MSAKRIVKIIIALGLTAGLLAACGAKDSDSRTSSIIWITETPTPEVTPSETLTPTETPTPEVTEEPEEIPEEEVPREEIPEGMVKSILTGEYLPEDVGTKRPVAFMVDNVKGAFPHHGNASASVYFEAPVEAELTRECIVFEDYENVPRISSLRSCRDYFISYALGFDSIYCHYGQAAYALPYLESDTVNNISGLMGYGGRFFFRVSDLAAPHNAATTGAKIAEAVEYLGYRNELQEDFQGSFKFLPVGEKADLSDGADAFYVTPGFSTNQSWFEYNEEDGLYYRYQYGGKETDGETGEQIAVENIILEYENASTYDVSLYVHFDTTSGGRGKYISDGKAIDITWERDEFYGPATYYREDGSVLEMNTGKTWVSIIKKKDIRAAKLGTSKSDATCVVSDEIAAQLERENASWEADFKANEAAYRANLDQILADELASHGGRSKVE